MTKKQLPKTDSIAELANFWDTHDLTDFEDELEEVTEPVFIRDESPVSISVHLQLQELETLQKLAKAKGTDQVALVREWVLEKLQMA